MGIHHDVKHAADCLNYETRILRDPLYRSNERVKSAKGKAFADLVPRQNQIEDWDPPEQGSGDMVATMRSDSPEVHEMQQALSHFESELSCGEVSSRDRAFFSALRCLLSEILTERSPQERDTKLRAVCKWFLKYKPRGSSIDSSTSAVLATSLSIPAPPQAPKGPQQAAQHHATSGGHALVRLQGTKHEFNTLFSRGQDSKDQIRGSTLALLREAMGDKARPPPAVGQQKQRVDMPMVFQPSSSTSRRIFTHGPAASNLVPRDRTRSQGTLGASRQQYEDSTASSWFQGPYKPIAAPISAQMPRPRHTLQAKVDPHEVDMRRKWVNMAQATAQADAHVDCQLQAWSHERAQFEGEMLRKQEASRHSSPLKQHHAGGDNEQFKQQGSSYLSAYQGVTVEAVSAMTSGLDKSPSALQNLVLPHSIVATAREVRMMNQEEYERDMQRLHDLGMTEAQEAAMQKALAPVADKSYLELLSALPKPGQHLISRPDSVPSKKKKPESGKKGKRNHNVAT